MIRDIPHCKLLRVSNYAILLESTQYILSFLKIALIILFTTQQRVRDLSRRVHVSSNTVPGNETTASRGYIIFKPLPGLSGLPGLVGLPPTTQKKRLSLAET